MILIDYFFPFCLKSSQLLAADLRIFYGHGSFHMLEVIDIFFKIFDGGNHLIHAPFGFLGLFMLSFNLLLDGYFFVFKGLDLVFEIYRAGLFLLDLFFNESEGFFLVSGLGKVV